MPFLHLFRRFILRALLKEKARSSVAALGIALGVAKALNWVCVKPVMPSTGSETVNWLKQRWYQKTMT